MNNTSKNLDAYPSTPFDEIALAISGGGFRAATYGLGTLMYLQHLTFAGKSLLERVKFMSSASGGSITVIFYLLSLYKKEDFDTFKNRLLEFMRGEHLLHEAQKILADDAQWQNTLKTQNLINAFAKVYDQSLDHLLWKSAWEVSKNTHLKEVCINATEFRSGLSFRFQNSEAPLTNIIGNYLVKVKLTDEVKKLRMGDLLAASSCFPLGFEPIMFPKDFATGAQHEQALLNAVTFVEANSQSVKGAPFALMDGGITDNQGVESMMWAFDRRFKKDRTKTFDLMLVADVSNRIIPPYHSPKIHFEDNNSIEYYLSLINKIFQFTIWAGLLGTITSILVLLLCTTKTFGLLLIVPSVICLFGSLYLREKKDTLMKKLNTKIEKIEAIPTSILQKYLRYFGSLKITILSELLITRLDSVSTMTGEVFLKRIRRLVFEQFYSDKTYDFRRVSSFIYALSKGYQKTPEQTEEKKKTKEPEKYPPTEAMMDIAEQARTFGTTLWFSATDEAQQMKRKLIATAQFTLCHSLLNYIVELENESAHFKDLTHVEELKALKRQLLDDWGSFKNDPLGIK